MSGTDPLSFFRRTPTARRGCRGRYHASVSGSIQTAADAATGGRLWLFSINASVYVVLRRFVFHPVQTPFVANAAPRLQLERVTFTGTPSGTTVTEAKADSVDFSSTGGTLRTTAGGVVLTTGAVIAAATISKEATAAGAGNQDEIELVGEAHEIVLRNLEGVVFRQAVAGVAAEDRPWDVNLVWEEYDL